ncbi:MAG: hypothetical protein ACYDA5_10670 [Vulcanimicrobiaceae bacterium]
MPEQFHTAPPQWSAPNSHGQHSEHHDDHDDGGDIGKVLLVGVLGGLASAAGYLVYQRLPGDQKERLQAQVRSLIAQRITEIRQNFNI